MHAPPGYFCAKNARPPAVFCSALHSLFSPTESHFKNAVDFNGVAFGAFAPLAVGTGVARKGAWSASGGPGSKPHRRDLLPEIWSADDLCAAHDDSLHFGAKDAHENGKADDDQGRQNYLDQDVNKDDHQDKYVYQLRGLLRKRWRKERKKSVFRFY